MDANEIVMLPIGQVSVLNPRSRNKKAHQEITDNIEAIGLKRPITVRRRADTRDGKLYDVVCGEGRLESLRQLGQTEIPAVIVDASEEDCLVMGLVENLARPQHRPIDLMGEIGSLKQRGFTDNEIAAKTGLTASWVCMVVTLLTKGEQKLVSAVETGLIPICMAVDIARADDAEVQDVLAEAYAQGKIKGKKLGAVRRMLDQRRTNRKRVPDGGLWRHIRDRKLTPDDLLRLYQREAEKQQLIVKRSDLTRSRLLFVVEALRHLLADEGFAILLRAERLNKMPEWLDARIADARRAST
jgi:ParB family chromosome partitioning protein